MSLNILFHWSVDNRAVRPRRHECPLESSPCVAILPGCELPKTMSRPVEVRYGRKASQRKRGSALPEQGVPLRPPGGCARACRDNFFRCSPSHTRSKRPEFHKVGSSLLRLPNFFCCCIRVFSGAHH